MSKTTFIQSQLSFKVKDVRSSVKFYTDVLGFTTESYLETPWELAIVKYDNIIIHLNKTHLSGDIIQSGCGVILLEGIEAFWERLKDSDWVLTELEIRKFGNNEVKEFALRDLDGNNLRFQEKT